VACREATNTSKKVVKSKYSSKTRKVEFAIPCQIRTSCTEYQTAFGYNKTRYRGLVINIKRLNILNRFSD